MTPAAARAAFAELVAAKDDELPLARAAVLIAAEHDREADVAETEGALDELAAGAEPRVRSAPSTHERLGALAAFLFGEAGFHPNRSSYYDPENSFLHRVLARRTGIPITLAVVFIEVASRCAFEVRGVGFPGHFLVKAVDLTDFIVDPFTGEFVDGEACEARYHAAVGEHTTFDPNSLKAASSREILARILRNLKQIFVARSRLSDALACCDRALLVTPDDPTELRDRGIVLAGLEAWQPAAADLDRFLELAPDDPTAPGVRAQLTRIRSRIRALH